jgi:hypothetical protein
MAHFAAAPLCRAELQVLADHRPPTSAGARHFTVNDDVQFSQFGDLFEGGSLSASAFSPDGAYFVVNTERGRLDLNRPESVVRIFQTKDIKAFLAASHRTKEPTPIWRFGESTCKNGPIVSNIRWLADSGGIAFLARTPSDSQHLMVADIKTKTVHPLTSAAQDVTAFDIRDSNLPNCPFGACPQCGSRQGLSQTSDSVAWSRALDEDSLRPHHPTSVVHRQFLSDIHSVNCGVTSVPCQTTPTPNFMVE